MKEDELLHLALAGGETEWEELQKLCRDRKIAEALARALERSSNDSNDVAVAWAGVLGDLHPDLKVVLPPLGPTALSVAITKKVRALRILCAEDHEQICEILRKVLSDAGHQVECFLDGETAWDRISIASSAFDLVITDHQMPGLSGLDLVRKLRGISFGGQILVHSGNLTTEIEGEYRQLHVDRIIRKTVRPEAIVQIISEFAYC